MMSKIKRITANLPEELIIEATSVTKAGITDTLIQGLKMIKRSTAYEKAQVLKGKFKPHIDLDVSRERHSR